jgi:flagellar biosynthesis protein FlhG
VFDQASTLRRLMQDFAAQDSLPYGGSRGASGYEQAPIPRVLAVSGGKGGVGKTLTTANLGLCFARLGMRTLLIDGDLGLANLDVVLGIHPKATIEDVLNGEASLKSVIVQGPGGLRVVPAMSGVLKTSELGRMQKLLLLDSLDSLDEEFDIVLVDTPAGVSRNVQYWTASAAEVIVIATPEPTSLADAYATMKILKETTSEYRFKLLVNMVKSEAEGLRVFEKLSSFADEYLKVRVEYLGAVPFDECLRMSVRERVPCVQKYPLSPASQSFRNISSQILATAGEIPAKGTVQFFWRRMIVSGEQEIFS